MPQVTAMPKIELPELDVTAADHAKYDEEYEDRWDGYPVDSIVAQYYCRERQLHDALVREQAALSELSELRKADELLEREVRENMWLGHGHDGIYGDDGEMQCGECMKFGIFDYKREPLDRVREVFMMARLERKPDPLPASAVEEKKA